MSQGDGYEREVINKIETLTNTPATTSIVAGMEALKALSVRRVGLVNPYPSELNAAVIAFMKGHGFEVDAVVSLGADFTRIGDVSEADVYAAAKTSRQASRLTSRACIYRVRSFRRWTSSMPSSATWGFPR